MYSKSYFNLQYNFAKLLQKKFGLDLVDTIFLYTNIFLQLTFDYTFNQQNKLWLNFCEQFVDSPKYLYQKVKEARLSGKIEEEPKHFGCFSYNYLTDKKTIKMHFLNRDPSGSGPLAKANAAERTKELSDMFADIKSDCPEAEMVKGRSWLYNLESYKRLFPPKFITLLTNYPKPEWQYTTRWGQLLNSEGGVKQELVDKFLACATTKASIEAVLYCFPFPILTAAAPIRLFYDYYKN